MTLDQIDRLVRQANPVPDLTALEPVDASVLDEQRRTEMQTHDRVIVDREPEPPRRNRLIGIAAAVLAAVVGVLLLRQPPVDAPVADQPPAATASTAPSLDAAVALATDFLAAHANRDADQVASYLSAGVLADLGGIEALRSEFNWAEVTGFVLLPGRCKLSSFTPTETSVRCAYDYHGIRSEEIGLGPFTGSWYDLAISSGEIVLLEDKIQFMQNGFNTQVWTPFFNWVTATHPDDVPVMYSQPSPGGDANMTPESIALWDQRSREYVEVVRERSTRAVTTASQFVEFLSAFKMESAAFYLAPDADLWLADVEQVRLENRLLEANGFKLLLDSCEQRDTTPDGIVVRCLWDFHAIRSDKIGLGPFTGSWFDLTVQDGKIVAASMHWGITEFSPQVWEPFAEWVRDTHPEDVDVMYVNPYANYRLTEESIALWEQRSHEYVDAVLEGQTG